mgnify:CR=1 FL=1
MRLSLNTWSRGLTMAMGTLMLSVAAHSVQAAPLPPLQTVPSVDLTRYQGRWYQIAYYPNVFQKQCVGNTTADYKLLPTGLVEVINQCKTADGSLSKVVGAARVKPPKVLGVPVAKGTNTSKLEVRFAPVYLSWLNAVWAPYWVIQLADDYRYAVVGEPNREFLWILSRTPQLDPQDRAIIGGLLQQQGYDPLKLVEEPQN